MEAHVEYQNYERELKYLLTENGKLTLNSVLNTLNCHDYTLLETITKEKHEIYYDDSALTLLNSGDVIRGSKQMDTQYFGFMYKKNVSDPKKPYVSKIEVSSGKYETIECFINALGLNMQLYPILYAKMMRDTAIIEKYGDRFLITYDKVNYFESPESPWICEDMIEVEDWSTPNSQDVRIDYDAHLYAINDILLNKLPITLTKHAKPYRGYVMLNKLNRN